MGNAALGLGSMRIGKIGSTSVAIQGGRQFLDAELSRRRKSLLMKSADCVGSRVALSRIFDFAFSFLA
jgi:hypothetical protein